MLLLSQIKKAVAEGRTTAVTGGEFQWDHIFIILILGKEKHRPRTITTEVLEQRAFLNGLRVSDVQLPPKCKSFGSCLGNAAVLP